VEDGTGTGQRRIERGGVEEVGGTVVGCRVAPLAADVDRADVMSGPQQVIDHVAADEAAAPGYCDAHACAPAPAPASSP
jgi:hypothetical protein